jgi:hypothetical protein
MTTQGAMVFACGRMDAEAVQQMLAESIARDLGPKGLHVAYVIIDAVIDLEWTRVLRFRDWRRLRRSRR